VSWRQDYYDEAIRNALEEGPAGGTLTEDQVINLVEVVAGASENEWMVDGSPYAGPGEGDAREARVERERRTAHERELAVLQREIDIYRTHIGLVARVDPRRIVIDSMGDVIVRRN
jgi:hypothetical protein